MVILFPLVIKKKTFLATPVRSISADPVEALIRSLAHRRQGDINGDIQVSIEGEKTSTLTQMALIG